MVNVILPIIIVEFKGFVHFQIKQCPYNFPYNVIQDVYVFLSLVENKLRFFMKTLQDLYPFS